MEHATALVDRDATTTTCHCHKTRAAGWTIRCYACGAGFEDGAVSRFADALYLEVEAEDRLRERGERIRAAGPLVDEDDRVRDDQLVDEAEGRAA